MLSQMRIKLWLSNRMTIASFLHMFVNQSRAVFRGFAQHLDSTADNFDRPYDGPPPPSLGVFNYRTDSLDDGTDAYGWYEDD
jgi:hypothetical protein